MMWVYFTDTGLFSVEENDGELIIIWFSLTLTPIDAGDGPLFTITYGVNAMGPHASQITEEERWKIVYYIQEKLQK